MLCSDIEKENRRVVTLSLLVVVGASTTEGSTTGARKRLSTVSAET